MTKRSPSSCLLTLLFALSLLLPGLALAEYKRLVIFGTSLSDSGNAFALSGQAVTAPYEEIDALLIPAAPYAKGGHRFSDGATWIEQLARDLGLAGDAQPAFRSRPGRAANYAVGGARANPASSSGVDLSTQVAAFLGNVRGVAPSNALYVVEMGSNDIRDALMAYATGGDGAAVIAAALGSIGNNISALYASGARHFLVANAPNLGLTPAVRMLDQQIPGAAFLGSALSLAFNQSLESLLTGLSTLPGINIVRLDVHGQMQEVVADPADFGLSQVQAPCLTPRVAPFTCSRPQEYLFWDGMHPTSHAHAIFARAAARALTPAQ